MMNPQNPISCGRPTNGLPSALFFLPLVGIVLSFASNAYWTFLSASPEAGSGIGFLLTLVTAVPVFIGALLIGTVGMKDWRRIGVLLLGVSALLSFGYNLLDLLLRPRVEIATYGMILTVFSTMLDFLCLLGSILLAVNRQGGCPLVRLGGLLFLFRIVFAWVSTFVIHMMNEPIAEFLEIDLSEYYQGTYRYIWFGRTLVILLLNAIGWIALAAGVIRERRIEHNQPA